MPKCEAFRLDTSLAFSSGSTPNFLPAFIPIRKYNEYTYILLVSQIKTYIAHATYQRLSWTPRHRGRHIFGTWPERREILSIRTIQYRLSSRSKVYKSMNLHVCFRTNENTYREIRHRVSFQLTIHPVQCGFSTGTLIFHKIGQIRHTR